MRTISHRYSNEDDKYVDSTYYDVQNNSLDVGFQRLKIFDNKIYPNLLKIKSLFVHHNNLNKLPDPILLPHLTQLNCANNNLKSIPFYPKLLFLNISHNKVIELNDYHNSDLDYLDCSFNQNINLNIHLKSCKHLYINDVKLSNLKLSRFQTLHFLDCSNNNLSELDSSDSLIELNVENNHLTRLPSFSELSVLMIDNNFLTHLITYPKLTILNASHNKLIKIGNQPQLTKIIASYNVISSIGHMPNLEIIELDNNRLQQLDIPNVAKHICIQFNPIVNLNMNRSAFQNIEELQVDYKLYENIYAKCYDNIKMIDIFVCENKIDEKNKKLETIFDAKTLKYIKKMFLKTKFQDRSDMFVDITIRIRNEYFDDNDESVREKCAMTLKNISKLYHKTIIVSLIFNF